MFVLEGGASARIKTDEERDEVNALLRLYQERFDVTFASFRDALLFMARNPITEPNPKPNTGEVIEIDKIRLHAHEYAEKHGLQLSEYENTVIHALINEPESLNTNSLLVLDQDEEYAQQVISSLENYVDNLQNETLPSTPSLANRIEKCVDMAKRSTQLSENQVLIDLNADQHKILETVNGNRNKLLPDYGKPLESFADTLTESFFHKGTLFNWHEQFYTGLNE